MFTIRIAKAGAMLIAVIAMLPTLWGAMTLYEPHCAGSDGRTFRHLLIAYPPQNDEDSWTVSEGRDGGCRLDIPHNAAVSSDLHFPNGDDFGTLAGVILSSSGLGDLSEDYMWVERYAMAQSASGQVMRAILPLTGFAIMVAGIGLAWREWRSV